MQTKTKSRPLLVMLVILLHILLGIGAIVGGGALILSPDGSLTGIPLYFLDNSPFSDFLIPGLILFIFNGLYPLVVAYSLWALPSWRWPDAINPFKQTHWSWAASLAVGVILVIWISVQVQFIPYSPLQVIYFCWGVVTLALTLLPAVRRYCSRK